VVAELGRPHGLGGEIHARIFGLTPEELLELPRLRMRRRDGSETPVRVVGAWDRSGDVVLEIEGLGDRNDAEAARGASLVAEREDLPAPDEGSWYLADVVGSEVVTEEGRSLGTLSEVLRFPAHDVYVVRGNGEEILLPATEEVVREMDLESRRMTVRLLPGLEPGASDDSAPGE
jgi:16S rRNA processing protein RimM